MYFIYDNILYIIQYQHTENNKILLKLDNSMKSLHHLLHRRLWAVNGSEYKVKLCSISSNALEKSSQWSKFIMTEVLTPPPPPPPIKNGPDMECVHLEL